MVLFDRSGEKYALQMKKSIIKLALVFNLDVLVKRVKGFFFQVYLQRLSKRYGVWVNYVDQGPGGLVITDVGGGQFQMASTSHLKSGTFIECSGGVSIGGYFHPGRGLTIFSSNHNYEGGEAIPYDSSEILKPVTIGDFVWCGSNVTIVPGVTIGEGAVIGAGSVVTKDVPRCAVMGGNPAGILKYRDIAKFERLKNEGKFY